MKNHIFLVLLSFLLLASSCGEGGNPRTEKEALISQINGCAKLYTSQYNVHKIVSYEDLEVIEGSIFSEKFSIPIPGDRKFLIPIEATIKTFIDFGEFSEDNINITGEKITITLPQPQIELSSSKIDHENEKEFVSWNRSNFSEKEKEAFIRQGRASILNSISQSDILEKSRISAFNALLPILNAAGYKSADITIIFSESTVENYNSGKIILPFLNQD